MLYQIGSRWNTPYGEAGTVVSLNHGEQGELLVQLDSGARVLIHPGWLTPSES